MDESTVRDASCQQTVADAVHAPMLMRFVELVERCGNDARELLRQADLAVEDMPAGRTTYAQVARLLEVASHALKRPDFGMMLALEQCQSGIEGPLGQVMRHAGRFDDMLRLAVRYGYAHSLGSRTWLEPSLSGNSMLFGHDIVLEGTVATSQVIEQILLIGHMSALRLTGGAVRPRRILVRHARKAPPHVYRRYFGCEVRFDQRVNATVYRMEDMARPIISADFPAFRNELAAMEQQFAHKQLPLSRIVRGAVLHALDQGNCTAGQIGDQLGLHVRHLHRTLAREGTSFRRIKDAVRRDLAGHYLRNTELDIRAISERLGFSEQSALARRVRTWFDGSPSQVRAGLSEGVKPELPHLDSHA